MGEEINRQDVIYTDYFLKWLTIYLFVLLLFSSAVYGQSFLDQFKDSTDNNLDFSNWMKSQAGFMPYTNIITEPAVGFGLAGGLVFFDPFSKHASTSVDEILREKKAPPDIAAVFGFGTQNGSWGAGAYYKGFWKQDSWRYNGFLGYLAPKLDFYGGGDITLPNAVTFSYKGWMLSQELDYRFIGAWFAGLRYFLFDYKIRPDGAKIPEGIPDAELDATIASISPVINFDSRDNIFTTNKGLYCKAAFELYDEFVGSDLEFKRLETLLFAYIPIFSRILILGLRYDGGFSSATTPFFSLPAINMRGIPVNRYQNYNAITIESEQRWNITFRWSLISFFGIGKAYKSVDTFNDQLVYGAGECGIRYFMAREFDLYGGVDIARDLKTGQFI
jgi:hypothetical protein